MIVGICRSKNNQTIIEPFVRHHLQLLDRLLICDNGSVDNTKEILGKLSTEDKRLIVSHDDSFGDFQSSHYAVLMGAAAGFRPKYIIPLDADEFLGVRDRDSLKIILKKIPARGCGITYWRNFVVTPDTVEQCIADAPKGFRYRRRIEVPPLFGKAIISTDGRPAQEFVLTAGNHDATDRSGKSLPKIHFGAELPLLHFPVTCKQQLLAKTVIHWMAFLVRDAKARETGDDGWQTMRNYDRIMKNQGQVSDADLCDMSLMYCQDFYAKGQRPDLIPDTHGIQYERKYSTGESIPAIVLIAKAWEQSLTGER